MWDRITVDYLIIGSGISGLSLSLKLADHGTVAVACKGFIGSGNSRLAQGGIAAAIDKDDSELLHLQDTIGTGQELCDEKAAAFIISSAKSAIEALEQLGVPFDRDSNGRLKLGREGAHSRNRIVHAGGDSTGRVIMEKLIQSVRSKPTIQVYEQTTILDLLLEQGECCGAIGALSTGDLIWFESKAVVLATGGLGQLYQYTTNSIEVTGEGYGLALHAGAVLTDMEFIQFHPTALKTDTFPLPLVSEAVRGEGATLLNSKGELFMKHYHPLGDLAARDVVSRSIYRELQSGCQVFLDAACISSFSKRFPTIFNSCRLIGIDPERDLIPVVPAVHYCMGGIQTDLQGQSSIPRLFAIGEAAASGLHGANRLASNSLLEGLVTARNAEKALIQLPTTMKRKSTFSNWKEHHQTSAKADPDLLKSIQSLMWKQVGIVRNEDSLKNAFHQLETWYERCSQMAGPDRNMLAAALAVVKGALWRKESRGAHYRSDYPTASQAFKIHYLQGGPHEPAARKAVFGTSAY